MFDPRSREPNPNVVVSRTERTENTVVKKQVVTIALTQRAPGSLTLADVASWVAEARASSVPEGAPLAAGSSLSITVEK